MDRVIDAANAYRLLFHNSAKRPLSPRNPHIEETLKKFVETLWKWATNSKSKSKVPCCKGLPLTANAIVCLYHNIRETSPDFELAAGLCNQDSLEHLFSKLRQRGGHVSNPTGRMVRLGLRHILASGKIEGGIGSNVQIEEKNLEMLINSPSEVEKAFEGKDAELPTNDIDMDDMNEIESAVEALERNEDLNEAENTEAEVEQSNSEEKEDSIYSPPEISFYERNAVAFFAGYVASKCFLKANCEKCREDMMKTPMEEREDSEHYIRMREYANLDEDAPEVEKLTRPRDLFANIVYEQLQAFQASWEKYWASENIIQYLSEEAQNRTRQHFPEWFNADSPCQDHLLTVLRFMLRVKIYAKTRERNGQRQATTTRIKKKGRKVNIVMNN